MVDRNSMGDISLLENTKKNVGTLEGIEEEK